MSSHVHTPTDPRVFVFGSNLKGIHGAGAARYACRELGYPPGVGEGIPVLARAYALPTCSAPGVPLRLEEVRKHVEHFLNRARIFQRDEPGVRFFISEIGCGLAGFSVEQIAPMFAGTPGNCDLPPSFVSIITSSMGLKEHTFNLTVGDWAGDGHGMSDTYTVVANREWTAVRDAHQRGCELTQVDFTDICCDYEDNVIPPEMIARLKGFGLIGYDDPSSTSTVHIDPFEFAELYMFIARVGDPGLTYRFAHIPEIRIGGYGLFFR